MPAPHHPRAAGTEVEEIEFDADVDEESKTYYDDYTGTNRKEGGYTPFEFISFDEELPLRHEVRWRPRSAAVQRSAAALAR